MLRSLVPPTGFSRLFDPDKWSSVTPSTTECGNAHLTLNNDTVPAEKSRGLHLVEHQLSVRVCRGVLPLQRALF